ncbi:MAG TPA: hypothetical protein VMN58_09855, partial [Acidimicrobiales bacterium]|nr:hypothetical protein [Acidimicrobiales bacterium]
GGNVRRTWWVLSATALAFVLVPAPVGAAPAAPPPTPQADCGPGSRPEPAAQGRAPLADYETGRAQQGYTCNLEEIAHFGNKGGYKVHRYIDAAGRECAYYDSTLLFPTGVADGTDLTGVYVLDMSDPANPVKTTNLMTPAMQSPHESLELNQERGLLAAGMGYPTFNPGFVDIYDVNEDCRNPVLKSSTPLGVLGHESGFAPDGNTFYVSSTGGNTITALDVTDPSLPKILWVGREGTPHGMRVSADGNRLYIADISKGLVILDVTEIQARAVDPQVTPVSALQWEEMSIPQVPLPVTIKGNPYLIEIDEFSRGPSAEADAPVGAGRIIDISDETKPQVVSHLRLEVNNPEQRAESMGDPGTSSFIQGYTGHYCSVPRTVDPEIVACTFVASGLRIFDVRDPLQPKEIAYFNKPVGSTSNPNDHPSSYAMSASAFVPERNEIWYLDGNSGFYVLRFTNDVWPADTTSTDEGTGTSTGDAAGGRDELPASGGGSGLGVLAAGVLAAVVLLRPRHHRLRP